MVARRAGCGIPAQEHLADRFLVVAFPFGAGKSVGTAWQRSEAPRICGHNQDDIAEVDLLAVMVRQLAVIHDLQQHVEQNRRMRFLKSRRATAHNDGC